MARKRDILCAGPCGQMIYSGKGCLPEGKAMCQPCRRTKAPELATCEACGTQFVPGLGYRRRACGQACSDELRRGKRPSSRIRACEVCGDQYERSYGDQRTCGRDCGLVLRQQTPRRFTCEGCGEISECPSTSWAQRFCSDDCRPKASTDVECRECGSIFDGAGGQKICSAKCRAVRNRRYNREYNGRRRSSDWDRSDRICPSCEREFTPCFVGQVYHDQVCLNRAKRKRERATGVRYSGDLHRHRARKFGRKYVPIKPLTIFERDGWVCQICLESVPKDKKSPHPLSPTLDHIIPMSCEGGDHVPENVQLAHFRCNSVKGAKIGTVQLKLIA